VWFRQTPRCSSLVRDSSSARRQESKRRAPCCYVRGLSQPAVAELLGTVDGGNADSPSVDRRTARRRGLGSALGSCHGRTP
jgi:hypothetical protein